MNKLVFISFLLLVLVGCNSQKTKRSFDTIDYSYYNGWDRYLSIKITAIGEVYILDESLNHTKAHYKYILTSDELEMISKLIDEIGFSNEAETINKENCADCDYYQLIIKTDQMVNKTFIMNSDKYTS